MRCPKCNNTEMAFTEETKHRKSILLNFLNIGVSIFFVFSVIIFIVSKDSSNPTFIAAMVITPIMFVVNMVYNYIYDKTSRTKCICTKCGNWWYNKKSCLDDSYEFEIDRINEKIEQLKETQATATIKKPIIDSTDTYDKELLCKFLRTEYQLTPNINNTPNKSYINFEYVYVPKKEIDGELRDCKPITMLTGAVTENRTDDEIKSLFNYIIKDNPKPFLYLNKVKVNNRYFINYFVLKETASKIIYLTIKPINETSRLVLELMTNKYVNRLQPRI